MLAFATGEHYTFRLVLKIHSFSNQRQGIFRDGAQLWIIDDNNVWSRHNGSNAVGGNTVQLENEGFADKWISLTLPAKDGRHVDGRFLSESIARRAHRFVGVAITCHHFRHLAAELYLREDSNGLGIVSQHLGHRDFNTTRRFYAREQTRIATQRYHAVLTRKRQAVPARPRRPARPDKDSL